MEINDYLKLIDFQEKTLKKMEIVKEKYKYIKKEIKKYLIYNHESYYQYYEEWKKKNESFVVKTYEFKELINDLKKLIPNDEIINISCKDKRNFSLILYLFQTNHFLKDYI